ncbi:cupin domain-containing protein [Shewanella sp. Isolate11]|uniref:ribosomal protein uL16 3-hydroxylase n=1 Tax=Shewanella sp. Isolate11 TaxID=2908530 RepID=UPI001EFD039B|nr:cupin domain-containing protein [Shewanella sp. Isolate11]MCG9697017.1 cupin domain-containing protein [Shewanella sp. Isolate11]
MYTVNFDPQAFLQQHWQKQPLVIKAAFKHFQDPISPEELAGLACEEEIASRIVLTKQGNWEIIQGPIEDYSPFGEDNWQLLVQAVNHWYPDSQPLVDAFRFIPDWRFDDLMVSFATPGGGVGPHIDNYDVFLLQGEGKRRWKVGAKGQYSPRGGDTHTSLIDDFEPIIDVILEAGDMLYIPPGFPHRGETLETALSYSIGFRAPSQQELLSSIADHLIDTNSGLTRFTSQQEPNASGLLTIDQQQGMMDLLQTLLTQPEHYQNVLGHLLSQNRFELDLCEPQQDYHKAELISALEEGAELLRIGGLKVIQIEADQQQRLFINGESYSLGSCQAELLTQLANQISFDSTSALELCQQTEICDYFLWMLNRGYAYLA